MKLKQMMPNTMNKRHMNRNMLNIMPNRNNNTMNSKGNNMTTLTIHNNNISKDKNIKMLMLNNKVSIMTPINSIINHMTSSTTTINNMTITMTMEQMIILQVHKTPNHSKSESKTITFRLYLLILAPSAHQPASSQAVL